MSTAYQQLTETFEKAYYLKRTQALLNWDSAVMLPAAASAIRARQVAIQSDLIHQTLCHPALSQLLKKAHAQASTLDPWQQANLREMQRLHLQYQAVPEALNSQLAEQTVHCEQAWRAAKTNHHFNVFAEAFMPVLELIRQKSETVSQALGLDPYSALVQEYDASVTKADCDSLFTSLSRTLPTLIRKVESKQSEMPKSTPLDWNAKTQMRLCRHVVGELGFDFQKGRLDKSAHPFTEGGVDDVRMTTQLEPHQPLHSLLSAIHECGHALYDLHLPKTWHTQPVGAAQGMATHEGIALFYEMSIARSTHFAHYLQRQCERLGLSASVNDIYLPLLKVSPGVIRIQADEVTYLAHLILRYEIETKLLEGTLEVTSIPQFWNERISALLGVTPANHSEGCLQDIHWALGLFGYFPCYAIGFSHSCQLYRWLQYEIKHCDFKTILKKLDQHLFSQGTFETEFFLHSTNLDNTKPADLMINYLTEKYLTDLDNKNNF